MELESKALILAGGLGTRLRSVASDIPKPMISIYGRPFLEYQLSYLKRIGIKNIVLCVSYLRNHIVNYFGDGKKLGIRIEYAIEESQLGTGGAIKNAINNLSISEYFFVLNGDTFVEWDANEMLDTFFSENADMVILVGRAFNVDSSSIAMVGSGKIVSYREKPENRGRLFNNNMLYEGAGVYLMRKELIALWPGKSFSFEYDVIPEIVKNGKVYGAHVKENIYDIGTPATLNNFCRFLTSNPDLKSFRQK